MKTFPNHEITRSKPQDTWNHRFKLYKQSKTPVFWTSHLISLIYLSAHNLFKPAHHQFWSKPIVCDYEGSLWSKSGFVQTKCLCPEVQMNVFSMHPCFKVKINLCKIWLSRLNMILHDRTVKESCNLVYILRNKIITRDQNKRQTLM